MEKSKSSNWDGLLKEIRHLARTELSHERGITGADRDDLTQAVAHSFLSAAERDRPLAARLTNDRVRFAYLSTSLRRALMRMRRSNKIRQAHRLDELVAPAPGESPAKAAEGKDLVLVLKRRFQRGSDGRLALDVLRGKLDLSVYAVVINMSVRTARRRFVRGILDLRKSIDQP